VGQAMPIRDGAGVVTPGESPDDRPSMTAENSMTSRAPAVRTRPRDRRDEPYAVVGPARNEGHGKRLTAAFEALEVFPALAESRNRLLALIAEDRPSIGEVVRAIESDVALVIAVMRLGNGLDSPRRGQVESVVSAVEVLSPTAVQRLAANAETFEFFERGKTWDAAPERFRLHAVAVQRAADRLAAAAGYPDRDRLLVTALLHDAGKLVLMHAYPGYPRQVHGSARTPEERLEHERHELGVDHALVGGVLARRWNLPKSVASSIERHHADDAQGDAAFVRLADMLAHYSQGSPVSSTELLRAARAVGFGPSELRAVLYDLPYPSNDRPRAVEPCPLSVRELEVLKRLAQGMVYKQIALELSLSTSTVRTHLHNIYGKLGAVDRAQAVLHATERGWL
jgi:putative nucleotidyltransferase with HDIG domain